MTRHRSILPLCALLLTAFALSGCGKDWVNPNISNPRKEDAIFEQDSKICHRFAEEQHPQMNEVGQREPQYDDEMQRDEVDFVEHEKSYSAWEKCMRERGWITRKEYLGE
ncbi:hypothetical protein [Desulfovibrio oxyclinae]|jgi:hypothetical protein|uniref:hypothetical protein n=1 Tax=Desulfovibrio oxyclinae TaxID=63560 RepID=UPI000382C4D8|nr:hypothetical protein [Desulfovibrio oxyclinae]